MNTLVTHWMPAVYCALLSAVVLSMEINSRSGAWLVFFCFLPLSFLFVSQATAQMQREIRELREQLIELQNK